jgi:hypothetical protein
MAWFYEIHSADNTVLNRYGGFATHDAGKQGRQASLACFWRNG